MKRRDDAVGASMVHAGDGRACRRRASAIVSAGHDWSFAGLLQRYGDAAFNVSPPGLASRRCVMRMRDYVDYIRRQVRRLLTWWWTAGVAAAAGASGAGRRCPAWGWRPCCARRRLCATCGTSTCRASHWRARAPGRVTTCACAPAQHKPQADEEPLYVFDGRFGEVAPAMLAAYRVPAAFDQDFFSVLGEPAAGQQAPAAWVAG